MENVTLKMADFAEKFDDLMFSESRKAISKGFIIGKGKKLHWYISPSRSGFYYAYRLLDDGGVGPRRVVECDKQVTVIYN